MKKIKSGSLWGEILHRVSVVINKVIITCFVIICNSVFNTYSQDFFLFKVLHNTSKKYRPLCIA